MQAHFYKLFLAFLYILLDNSYGEIIMTSFILKIIGILTMLCDHIGDSFIGHFSFLNLIGRIAFPIFAFQVVQGYIHTHNVNKYALRLFIFAFISQIPFMLFLSTFYNSYYLNVFFTLFLGVICLYGFDKIKNKYLGVLFAILICIIGHFIQVDYGAYGIAVIFIFYIFNKFLPNKKGLMCLAFFIITGIKYLPDIISYPSIAYIYIACILFTSISLIPICIYNEKQGPKIKYLFYAFYPVHLLVLYIVHSSLQIM